MKKLQKIHPGDGPVSIGKLAKLTKTKVVTIRYYESVGLFPDPRGEGSRKNRKYSAPYIGRILFIREMRTLGFSLNEIKDILKLPQNFDKMSKSALTKKAYRAMDRIRDRMDALRFLKREVYKLITQKQQWES